MNALERFLYKSVNALVFALGSLPKGVREKSAIGLGRLLFLVDKKHRNIAIQNISNAFGSEKSPEQITSIARQVFENLFRIIFEVGWSLHLSEEQLRDYFHISGLEIYQQAMAKGKGVLFLLAHFGNWELLPIVARLCQATAHIVYRPLDERFLDQLIKNYRTRFGAELIPTQKRAMWHIIRALRQGLPVGMLMDQNVDWYDGVFVNFFDRLACTNAGMALLAIKSKAPVVPLFLLRRDNCFHALIGPELPLIQTGDHTKDVELNTEQYNRIIEVYARKFPDQWFWVHQRWKTRPYCTWPRSMKR